MSALELESTTIYEHVLENWNYSCHVWATKLCLLIRVFEFGIFFQINFKLGGSDKMQNLDLGPTHKTGGAKHKINDFCFLKFFISMKFYPSQAQKTIFSQFQQCGISLDMF